MSGRPEVERVQTGVRLEKRMVKVLKATAELYDLSLGELIEGLVNDAFAGRRHFADAALDQIAELARI
jgi:predicted DNA-binding ribbon-helix-helix protein